MKRFMLAALFVAGTCLLQGAATFAQTSTQSQASTAEKNAQAQDVEIMRKDIRSMRKQLVAANLNLTADQATKFWPVYDQYINELVAINNTKYDLLKEYFNSYGDITDAQADSMSTRLL